MTSIIESATSLIDWGVCSYTNSNQPEASVGVAGVERLEAVAAASLGGDLGEVGGAVRPNVLRPVPAAYQRVGIRGMLSGLSHPAPCTASVTCASGMSSSR